MATMKKKMSIVSIALHFEGLLFRSSFFKFTYQIKIPIKDYFCRVEIGDKVILDDVIGKTVAVGQLKTIRSQVRQDVGQNFRRKLAHYEKLKRI